VLPVVYEKGQGVDYAFYRALEVEALFFGIEPLRKWVKEKGYLQAVKIQYEEVKRQDIHVNGYDATVDGNTERSYHPSWGSEKVHQCPRGIFMHHGNPSAWGKACEKA